MNTVNTSLVRLNSPFHSVSSISAWGGGGGVRYLFGDDKMPYVEREGTWYYFGYSPESREYRLIATSKIDLMENKP